MFEAADLPKRLTKMLLEEAEKEEEEVAEQGSEQACSRKKVSYTVPYLARRGRCLDGRGAVLLVISQWNYHFKVEKNDQVLL